MTSAARQVVDRRLGPLWFPAADNVIAPAVAGKGIWEPNEGRWLDLVLKPGMVVVNAGANIGYFTLWAAQRVGSGGSVICIEPHPENRALLERNVADRALTNVRVVAAAASSQAGEINLFLNDINSGDHRVFDPTVAAAHAPGLAASSGGFDGEIRHITVPAVTIDDLVGDGQVDVIFTDTQGHDHEVLAGSTRVLANKRPVIMTEFVPDWIRAQGKNPIDVLRGWVDLGYRIGVWDAGIAPGEWELGAIVAWAEAPGRWFTNLELWPEDRDLVPRATPAEGFWEVERAPAGDLYWLTERAGVLRAAAGLGARGALVFELVAPPGGPVTVSVGGAPITVRGVRRMRIPWAPDPAGRYAVPIVATASARSAPGDPRPLYVGVRNPSLVLE